MFHRDVRADANDQPRLVAFDLDGTLIRGTNCVQTIGRAMGRPEWGDQFEVLHMRHESAEVVRARVQPWLAIRPEELARHLAAAQVAPGAREGFATLRQHGVATAIVSIGWSFAVEWFARFFGADHYVGTRLARDGSVSHFWPEDKGRWLLALAADLGIERSQLGAVGDSSGDIELLRAVGHPFYVGNVLPAELYTVTHLPGGNIHDIVDRMLGGSD